MKIDFTNTEIVTLSAILIGLSDDIEEMFSGDENEMNKMVRANFSSLSYKIIKESMIIMAREREPMNAEILAEEVDE